eukprot:48452-Rhodomonas_salina.2
MVSGRVDEGAAEAGRRLAPLFCASDAMYGVCAAPYGDGTVIEDVGAVVDDVSAIMSRIRAAVYGCVRDW